MNTIFRLFLLTFIFPISLWAQEGPPNSKEEFMENYERRIKKEVLNGVYIPKDLGEAFNELNKKIDQPSKEKFMSLPEEEASRKLHFSLGRWMMVNWGFYEGSRFSAYLKTAGISFPDDMAQFVMITYHRYLNDQPLGIKELAENFKAKRQKAFEEKLENSTILHKETRVLPKPDSLKSSKQTQEDH